MFWLSILLLMSLLAGLFTFLGAGRLNVARQRPGIKTFAAILAASLVWLLDASTGIVQNRLADEAIPSNTLNIFIEDISFGFPEIPSLYKEKRLRTADLRQISAPFRRDRRHNNSS